MLLSKEQIEVRKPTTHFLLEITVIEDIIF